ncbi:MAG: hypothetical protein ACM336_17125 [Acidobacteriota bacterium]
MTSRAAEIVAAAKITDVYRALTGKDVRRRRVQAWTRETRDYNVSLRDATGRWRDFVTDERGGMLDLIQGVRGGTRVEALRWLADFAGIPLEDREPTPAERREFARAAEERRNVEAWREDLIEALRARHNELLHLYHGAEAFLRAHPVDEAKRRRDARWALAFDTAFELWPRIEDLERRIDVLRWANRLDLTALFRTRRTA